MCFVLFGDTSSALQKNVLAFTKVSRGEESLARDLDGQRNRVRLNAGPVRIQKIMRVALLVAGALALRLDKPTVPPLSKQPWGEKWSLPYRQPMANMQNTQYSAEFNIGAITMRGIFDTGSFELLVRIFFLRVITILTMIHC